MLGHLQPEVIRARRKVDRRSVDITVTHHLRQAVYVAPSLEHQRCKSMPECVRAEVQLERRSELAYQFPQPVNGKWLVAAKRAEELGTGLVQALSLVLVPLQRLG